MKVMILSMVVCSALAACKEEPRAAPRGPSPALLGRKTPELIAHLESACPYTTYKHAISLSCLSLGDDNMIRGFDVVWGTDDGIDELQITLDDTDANILRLFDRAMAPILPDDTRELLRRSILDYASVEGITKFHFSPASHPLTFMKMWVHRTTKASRQVTWHLFAGPE